MADVSEHISKQMVLVARGLHWWDWEGK